MEVDLKLARMDVEFYRNLAEAEGQCADVFASMARRAAAEAAPTFESFQTAEPAKIVSPEVKDLERKVAILREDTLDLADRVSLLEVEEQMPAQSETQRPSDSKWVKYQASMPPGWEQRFEGHEGTWRRVE